MIQKTIFFLVILIAAVAIVSSAHSGDIPNISSAIAASAIPLPPLQFNYSQEKVVVSGELSTGNGIQSADGALLITSQNKERFTLPIGSIIHHTNNITTVFDNAGEQLFAADDRYGENVLTFNGIQPATFVHEVPDKSVIVDNGNILHVIYKNSRILTIIASPSEESDIPHGNENCIGPPYHPQWI